MLPNCHNSSMSSTSKMTSHISDGDGHEPPSNGAQSKETSNVPPGGSPARNKPDSASPGSDTAWTSPNGERAPVNEARPLPLPPPPGAEAKSSRQSNCEPVGRPWTTGLFDCAGNQSNSLMTAYFPCVTFGQIAEILDEGESSCALGSFLYLFMAPALCTCWVLGANYRSKLREKYDLVQAPAEDWVVHLFCPCCALCQEFRELQNRGIDPSLGWMGYLAQKQEDKTVPPEIQSMSA